MHYQLGLSFSSCEYSNGNKNTDIFTCLHALKIVSGTNPSYSTPSPFYQHQFHFFHVTDSLPFIFPFRVPNSAVKSNHDTCFLCHWGLPLLLVSMTSPLESVDLCDIQENAGDKQIHSDMNHPLF